MLSGTSLLSSSRAACPRLLHRHCIIKTMKYLTKHWEGELNSELINPSNLSTATAKLCIKPISISQAKTMSLLKEETLAFFEPKEFRIPIPFGHVAAKAWGNKDGKPVLGVHGWLDNAGTFDKLIPKLSKSLYIVAVDLPGHGRSSHVPGGVPAHFFDFVVNLRRILKHLNWTRFSWMGHSMGAGLGAYYASLYPAEVERLVMIDVIKAMTSDTNDSLAGKMAVSLDTYLVTESKISRDPPIYTYKEALERQMKAWTNMKEDAAKTLMVRGCRRVSEDGWTFSRDLRVRLPSIQRISHEQAYAIFRNIKCHNLLIKANNSPYFEKFEILNRVLEIYNEKCASFQFVQVDGDHFVHLSEPEKIADLVNRFLTEPKAGL